MMYFCTGFIPCPSKKRVVGTQDGMFYYRDDESLENFGHEQSYDKMRRKFCSSFIPIISTLLSGPQSSFAAVKAKGAAEYDLEFYMRNLVKGNNDREGNIQATTPPPLPPTRNLAIGSNTSFITSIINDELNSDCIAIRTLSQITKVPNEEIAQMIREFREKFAKAFGTRAKWQKESVTDEYYFDLTCYSLYRTAAVLIPSDYKLREEWVKLLGKEIYSNIKKYSTTNKEPKTLTESIPVMVDILEAFKGNNFISTYRLGDKNDDFRTGLNVFDSYDNEDIDSGLTVNCLISLLRPATLTSSLQIVGEGSRFMPEFIGTTIAAMWRKEMGLKVDYETYFVDEEYRPNPKDYFPSEQLLQYSIRK